MGAPVAMADLRGGTSARDPDEEPSVNTDLAGEGAADAEALAQPHACCGGGSAGLMWPDLAQGHGGAVRAPRGREVPGSLGVVQGEVGARCQHVLQDEGWLGKTRGHLPEQPGSAVRCEERGRPGLT